MPQKGNTTMTIRKFLTAEWRHLAMLNYEIDPALLQPYLPAGTELDFRNGLTYVSMVGFMFLNTKVLGVSIPFHINFEEVNLRFYVRRRGPEGWRRGVTFIKEIVPKPAIALVANWVYNENYVSMPMQHVIDADADSQIMTASYMWRFKGEWHKLWVQTQGEAQPLTPGSEEEFIAEHYWGYAAQRDGGCIEYQVEHPPWRVWSVMAHGFTCDVAALYDPVFTEVLQAPPTSVFLAEGSAVSVRQGVRVL